MVVDIFTYNGESDTLEMRLNILGDYVDQFIIVEAPETFSGKEKPLYYECHKNRFSQWAHKIKYYVVNDYPKDKKISKMAHDSPSVPKGMTHWHREFYQKESIKKALKHLKPTDTCFVGDCDEIWNPEILKVPVANSNNVYKLKQLVYAYYLNNRSSEEWAGTYLTSYKTIKDNCLNHLRTRHPWILIENAGWHFTNMGGANEIRRKLESYGHQEFNTNDIKDNLELSMFSNKDFIGRNFNFWIDESSWPQYLIDNRDRYKHLLKNG